VVVETFNPCEPKQVGRLVEKQLGGAGRLVDEYAGVVDTQAVFPTPALFCGDMP
jgi:hypothetical protein